MLTNFDFKSIKTVKLHGHFYQISEHLRLVWQALMTPSFVSWTPANYSLLVYVASNFLKLLPSLYWWLFCFALHSEVNSFVPKFPSWRLSLFLTIYMEKWVQTVLLHFGIFQKLLSRFLKGRKFLWHYKVLWKKKCIKCFSSFRNYFFVCFIRTWHGN